MRYSVDVAGSYRCFVQLNRAQCQGSPWTLTAIPGAVHTPNCFVDGVQGVTEQPPRGMLERKGDDSCSWWSGGGGGSSGGSARRKQQRKPQQHQAAKASRRNHGSVNSSTQAGQNITFQIQCRDRCRYVPPQVHLSPPPARVLFAFFNSDTALLPAAIPRIGKPSYSRRCCRQLRLQQGW